MNPPLLKNKKLWTGLSCLAALALLLAFSARLFTPKAAPGQAPLAATTRAVEQWLPVESRRLPLTESVVGTLQSRERVMLRARIMAAVESITAVSGTDVRQGDVLIELDKRDLASRISQAQQQYEDARAQFAEAEKAFERVEELLASRVASQAEFDSAKAGYDSAEARMKRAGEALAEARVTLSYATITAPLNARVVDKFVEPGDMVSPGQPLVEIYNPRSLRLEAIVRESLIQKLKLGQRFDVCLETLAVTVTGTLEEILPAIQSGSRSLRVRVALPETPGLLTGMFARMDIAIGEKDFLRIPEQAVERVGQLEFALLRGAGGAQFRRAIKTGRSFDDGYVEVLAGLAAGDTVGLLK